MPRILRLSFVLLLTAGGLAACGKRGQLDPPPAQQTAADARTGAAGAPQNKAGRIKRTPITAPKRELLIDGLLD